MNISEKKLYIEKFVCQGIEFEKALALVYCTDEEHKEIKEDKAFIEKLNVFLMDLSLQRIEMYNIKVNAVGTPSDELRRLSSVMNVIDTEDVDVPGDLHLTIVKQRGEKK